MASEGSGDAAGQLDREPDYRFTLANERTFLAWIRTSLGLVAVGVVIHGLIGPVEDSAARTVVALGSVMLAVLVAGGSYYHWRSVQRAMRRGGSLPGSLLVPTLALGATAMAIIALVVVLLT